MRRKVILTVMLPPGDVCTLTAAVESLHATYPARFTTGVRTGCDALFAHNPHVTPLRDDEAEPVELHYDELLHQADAVPNTFLRGYCHHLGRRLGVPLELTTNRPHLYLSRDELGSPSPLDAEAGGGPDKFWLVNAGVKEDFTLKQWPVEHYQAVVDHFRGRIHFVQVGAIGHDHPRLDGVVDLVGRTDMRQLVVLASQAQGGLGPVTLLQHLCAAFEKPYVALVGGREPVQWVQYPLQATLHTVGKLPCCLTRACWRSRAVPLGDQSEHDGSLCELPILGMRRPVGKCMAMIRPADVIRAIEGWYEGGALMC